MNEPVTEKKNQHYVPRFHLKRFSVNGNENEIRLFNLKGQKFVQSANLYNQASGDYYYGKDGYVEDQLQIMEGIFSTMINKMVGIRQPPKHNSEELDELISFIVISDLRNPISRDTMLASIKEVTDLLIRDGSDEFKEALRGRSFALKNPGAFSLKHAGKIIPTLKDLYVKLIENQTSVPFILSDNPVVKYNQFFEGKAGHISASGYAHEGVQIFVPLTPKYSIILYDSRMYYVGPRKGKIVILKDEEDVHQLNTLQFLNSYANVFGNEALTEKYMTEINQRSNRFQKPHKSKSKLVPVEGKPLEKILLVSDTELKTELKLSFTFLTTYASTFKLTNKLIYPREFALKMHLALENQERMKQKNKAI